MSSAAWATVVATLAVVTAAVPVVRAQEARPASGLHAPLDQILDLYVRDGLVYYRALRTERARLDRYVASLDVPAATYERWSRDAQVAFWLNAYNAFVLRTVIDHYPIRGRSTEYPPNSIRQIPGAFESRRHRAAGRAVTLDQIEREILAGFRDPRVFFALGRGALGGGRLRSEAFTAERLESQLTSVAAECATRHSCVEIDETAGQVRVSPIFGWREEAFVAAYAGGEAERKWPGRSPIERAILAFVSPHLFPGEQAFLAQNKFAVRYHEFDWRLNDLSGGAPR